MKNKRVWVCLLVFLFVLVVLLVLLPRDPITQANCDKIQPGMTLKQVEAILGKSSDRLIAFTGEVGLVWYGKTAGIHVCFDRPPELDGALVKNVYFITRENSKNLLEKIRDWLGL
jgi:hypothetical protein